MTVAAWLRARAGDDRPGVRSADDGREWSWAEVVAECATRAAWMAATGPGAVALRAGEAPAGVAERDRPLHVGVLLDNVPEILFLIGGAALSGSVIVALNTTRSAAELAGDADRADCDLIVTEPRHAARAAEAAALRASESGAPATPVLDSESDDHTRRLAPYRRAAPAALVDVAGPADAVGPADVEVDGETLLMLIFTSGTSGRPRAVRITHRKIVVPGESLAERFLSADDAVYCPMPLFHSGAVMAALGPALASGARIVLRRRFSASRLLPDVREHGCTYVQYVGKALSYALATPRGADGRDDADNPLRVAFGNEAAPMEQKAFAARFGCTVVDGYGSTETAIAIRQDPSGPDGALGLLPEGVKILDPETGAPCPPARFDAAGRVINGDEAIGELVNTAGAGLFDGYYKDDAPDRLRDGMFWSGDHAYADENGYVFFAGRSLDRLRVDGENFGAAQVERALAELPGADRLAVYGVPDVAAGDQVMVALVGDFDPGRLVSYLSGRDDLSPKWIPRYVRVSADLPATASNKILKRRLAEEAWLTDDPVWWRPGRETAYRRMTEQDKARLRSEFEARGRLHLLPVHPGTPAAPETSQAPPSPQGPQALPSPPAPPTDALDPAAFATTQAPTSWKGANE